MTTGSIRSDGSELRRRPLPDEAAVETRDNDDGSFLLVNSPAVSNADLYSMTPPAYAQSAADNEISVDAEAVQSEKGIPNLSQTPTHSSHAERNGSTSGQPARPPPSIAASEATLEVPPPTASSSESIPNELPPVYFQQLTQDAAIASIRRCSILLNRPAVWMVKRRDIALSPLAATVLIKEGIIKAKDLSVISQSAGIKRDPNDPLSGIAFATFDTVGDILLGLVEGPVEAAKQVQPLLLKQEQLKRGDPASVRFSVLQESSPLVRITTGPNGAVQVVPTTEPGEAGWKPPQGEGDPVAWEQRVWAEPLPQEHRRNSSIQAGANAASSIAMSTGKGVGRIVGATLKAPMTFTHAVTRGFHNVPKLYGSDVREYDNVVDLRSGLSVSAKVRDMRIHTVCDELLTRHRVLGMVWVMACGTFLWNRSSVPKKRA